MLIYGWSKFTRQRSRGVLQSPHAFSKVVERVDCVRCVIVVFKLMCAGRDKEHDASEETTDRNERSDVRIG